MRLNKLTDSIVTKTYTFFASKAFWVTILTFTIVQALWYVFSFSPVLFDEKRHLDFILLYTDYINPFIQTQTPAMDFLGQVSREPSYLYYFLLSIPLRAIQFFSQDFFVQTVILRLINTVLFVLSVAILRKVLLELYPSKAIANVIMLFFVLLPTVAPLSGTVTYDVGVLPLVAIILLLGVRIFKSRTITVSQLALLIILSCLASVIKFTSLPIIAAVLLVILFRLWPDRKSIFLPARMMREIKGHGYVKRFSILFLLFISLGLFIERPVQNIVAYKSAKPSCLETLPQQEARERCIKNYVYKRNIGLLDIKPDNFRPADPLKFLTKTWIPDMAYTTARQAPPTPPQPIMYALAFISLITCSLVLALGIREVLRKHPILVMALVVLVVYTGSVFYTNYSLYVSLGQPVAISARYLVPVVPLFLLLFAVSAKIVFVRYRSLMILSVPIMFICLLQGGGITSYILQDYEHRYWRNETTRTVNDGARAILKAIIVE